MRTLYEILCNYLYNNIDKIIHIILLVKMSINIVLNPLTSRSIHIGSKTYNKLCTLGFVLIDGKLVNSHVSEDKSIHLECIKHESSKVLNPKTKRMIEINGSVFKKLLDTGEFLYQDGVLVPKPKDILDGCVICYELIVPKDRKTNCEHSVCKDCTEKICKNPDPKCPICRRKLRGGYYKQKKITYNSVFFDSDEYINWILQRLVHRSPNNDYMIYDVVRSMILMMNNKITMRLILHLITDFNKTVDTNEIDIVEYIHRFKEMLSAI